LKSPASASSPATRSVCVSGEIASTDNLLELAADCTSAEFADRLRTLIVDGAEFKLDDDTCAPFLSLRMKKGTAGAEAEVPLFELLPAANLVDPRAHL